MAIEQIQAKDLYTSVPMTLALDGSAGENAKRAVLNGIAISTDYNSYNYCFSLRSIRSLAEQAKKTRSKNGVPLYVMHATYFDLPIGRTLTGEIKEDSYLEVSAYINRNVPNPDTNSIIDRIDDDTIDALSIGWRLTPKSYFKCDTCSEKMDKGYFMPYCKNYHYPGKKLDDGTIVTATVHGPIHFRELSIVGIGADPRAKILQDTEYQDALREEFNSLTINLHDIPLISELAGWDEGMFSESLSFFPINKGVPTMSHEPTGTENAETPSDAAQEWKNKYLKLEQEHNNLKELHENLPLIEESEKARANLQKQLSERTQELNETKTTLQKHEYYAAIGRVSLELARDRAERAFKFYKGNKIEDPVSQATLKKLQESDDLKWLEEEADEYWALSDSHKNTRAYEEERAPRTQRSFLENVEVNI